eukprot:scaffold8291_cov239-Pinguiococcus_pyrenoidosus.AAC.1
MRGFGVGADEVRTRPGRRGIYSRKNRAWRATCRGIGCAHEVSSIGQSGLGWTSRGTVRRTSLAKGGLWRPKQRGNWKVLYPLLNTCRNWKLLISI